jgi:hypothetical protein
MRINGILWPKNSVTFPFGTMCNTELTLDLRLKNLDPTLVREFIMNEPAII